MRLTAALGAGVVWHRLVLGAGRYAGVNSYVGLDLGPQVNSGPLLVDLVAQVFLEGVSTVRDGENGGYTTHGLLPLVGIGMRVGYCQWGTR